MSKNKFGIQFEGFNELMEKFDELGGDLKEVAEECLKVPNRKIVPKLQAIMPKHKRTGATAKSIVENPRVDWQEGTTASVEIGFNLKKGGMPSIFLMYGTPKMQKDTKLYNAIYGSQVQKEIAEEQRKILEKAINERMGGG